MPIYSSDVVPFHLRKDDWKSFIYVRNQFIASKERVFGRGAIIGIYDDDMELSTVYLTRPEIEHNINKLSLPDAEKILSSIDQYDYDSEFVVLLYVREGVYTKGDYAQHIGIVSKTGYGRAS